MNWQTHEHNLFSCSDSLISPKQSNFAHWFCHSCDLVHGTNTRCAHQNLLCNFGWVIASDLAKFSISISNLIRNWKLIVNWVGWAWTLKLISESESTHTQNHHKINGFHLMLIAWCDKIALRRSYLQRKGHPS